MIAEATAHGLLEEAAAECMNGRETWRKGARMKEVDRPVLLCLNDPVARMHCHPARRGNPWVSLAEFPWLMAGRADVHWLGHYLPRAVDFSDDGLTWRAGYGPRLRGAVDQVAEVVGRLEADPESRQAVATLWDPALDNTTGSMDYPCTVALHFQVTAGRLNLTVLMRSNDLIWGFSGVNLVNFTLLQEAVAVMLGIHVGRYFHVASNLHVYARHWRQAERLEQGFALDVHRFADALRMNLETSGDHEGPAERLRRFTAGCERALRLVEDRWGDRTYVPPGLWGSMLGLAKGHWLTRWAHFMAMREVLADGATMGQWERALADVRDPSWRASLALWAAAFGRSEAMDRPAWEHLLDRAMADVITPAMQRSRWVDLALLEREDTNA